MYVIYVYPSFLLLVFWIFERHKRLTTMAVLLLVYLIPQYTLVYIRNRSWNFADYLTRVQQATPKDKDPVVGRPNDWFAFQERPFFVLDYQGDFQSIPLEELYLIEDENYRRGMYPRLREKLEKGYTHKEVGRFSYKDEIIIIRKYARLG